MMEPINTDIKNHICRAKAKLHLSKFDQEKFTLKINQWKKVLLNPMYFFRPFKKKITEDVMKYINTTTGEMNEFNQSLLYVHQKWVKDLLMKYGNIISLMDATYKATKYKLPLFFICVKQM